MTQRKVEAEAEREARELRVAGNLEAAAAALATRRAIWLQLDLLQKLTLTAREAGWCGGPLCVEQLRDDRVVVGGARFCSTACHQAARAAWREALAAVRAADPDASRRLSYVVVAGEVS